MQADGRSSDEWLEDANALGSPMEPVKQIKDTSLGVFNIFYSSV